MSPADRLIDMVPRLGSRPAIRHGSPRIQIEQFPPTYMSGRLAENILQLPHVHKKESQIADPSVDAFWIPDEFICSGTKAFICDHEFCHLHPPPGTSLHLVLPDPVAKQAVGLGWAEPHPLTDQGFLPRGLLLVYAPRNDGEFKIVMRLVEASYRFAIGTLKT